MPTFQEAMRVAEITLEDKTSTKRAMEILAILRKNHVARGLTPEKAVAILQDLGPTYVKIGQIASNRSDILPQAYCEAFEQLRDHVTPLDFSTVIDCIEKAYGAPYTTVFASIEEKPLGSASIAQAHKGKLLDGTEVAIKVRRPGVVESMSADIMLMKHLLALTEFAVTSHQNMLLTLDGFVKELERTTADELDFRVELNNLVRFKQEIADQQGVTSPTPYPQYSNDAVLVMEFVSGQEINKVTDYEKRGTTRKEIANRLAQSYVKQMLDSGFFHADPHPGNIMLRGSEIVWIDLGMTGQLTGSDRQRVRTVYKAIATDNAYELKEAVLGLVETHGPIDHGALLDKLTQILQSYGSAELDEINAGDVLSQVIEILRTQNLILKSSVTMLARGIVTMEGVLVELEPSLSITRIVSQHVLETELSPKSVAMTAGRALASTAESLSALTKLPTMTVNTLDMLERGELSFSADVKLPSKTLAAAYTIANHLALAILSAGLFLASSMLCTTNMEPKILEVPLIGFIGYIAAVVLGIYVVWRILKERHQIRNSEDIG